MVEYSHFSRIISPSRLETSAKSLTNYAMGFEPKGEVVRIAGAVTVAPGTAILKTAKNLWRAVDADVLPPRMIDSVGIVSALHLRSCRRF